jgi:hypothetical protein
MGTAKGEITVESGKWFCLGLESSDRERRGGQSPVRFVCIWSSLMIVFARGAGGEKIIIHDLTDGFSQRTPENGLVWEGG